MYDFIRQLEAKLSAAESTQEEIQEAIDSLETGRDELADFIDEIQNLISSAQNLPSVNVYVNADVSFDSDDI